MHLIQPPVVARLRLLQQRAAFTVLEVVVSTLLVCIAMGNILMMNMRAASNLKSSREVAAISQMLQQRVDGA